MQDEKLWLETDYFENFRCKGGDCRNSCCEGWRISVSMREYFDLIGRDCSEELHHRLETAFVAPDTPSPENFRQIAPNWLGKCPMHGENGLCMLHSECGEGALPEICRMYPRSLKDEGALNQACCSCSCEAVIEILIRENQLHFCLARLPLRPEYSEDHQGADLKTAAQCMWALQDRDLPLGARILNICRLLGADAAPGDAKSAFDALISAMCAMCADSPSMRKFGKAAIDRYSEGGYEAYRADSARFQESFPRWQRWFENVIANHLLYVDFPWADARITPAQAAGGLCMVYALMRVMCAPCTDENAVVDALAGAFRIIEHSSFYYNARLFVSAAALTEL